ncbi:MAG: hypothetical protein PVSMB7_17010 [Chloroflexota bacterium]
MSWLDALLGRAKPGSSNLEQLFGMSTAQLTMETELGLRASGGAAISFRPVSNGQFAELEQDIEGLLRAGRDESPLTWHASKDPYGYEWIVLQGTEFENVVASVHMISRELQDNGYGEQLLASVFQFRGADGRNVYWVYNYKRGTFYPFVPAGGQSRDNPTELRLSSVLARELAVESDLTRWYALWGVPLS